MPLPHVSSISTWAILLRRLKQPCVLGALAFMAFFQPLTAKGQGGASLQGLGDLPGGLFGSNPHDISSDGSVVVGYNNGGVESNEPFLWTADGGTRGLGETIRRGGFEGTLDVVGGGEVDDKGGSRGAA